MHFHQNGRKATFSLFINNRKTKSWKFPSSFTALNFWYNFQNSDFWSNIQFFLTNNLIALNQSGFQLGESCINLLLSITSEIYRSFDNGLEISGDFSEISKSFDSAWHKGLIFKPKQNSISGSFLNDVVF